MKTQRQRILDLFLEKRDVMVYELSDSRPRGLGCKQYNARIKELRQMGYNIINVMPGHFRYIPEGEDMRLQDYETKLADLRKKWKAEQDLSKRAVIERQGRALRIAMESKKTEEDVRKFVC